MTEGPFVPELWEEQIRKALVTFPSFLDSLPWPMRLWLRVCYNFGYFRERLGELVAGRRFE